MKKTLVALAAMSAVASFAQSSVTISGNADFAYVSKSGTVARANGSTVTTGTGTSSTSAIKFTATEDLGGGLKLTGFYELDPRTLSDDSLAVTTNNNSTTTTTQGLNTSSVNQTVTGVARGEAYVQLSGGLGTVQLGAPNAFSLGTIGLGSPLGTGIGSMYTINGASGTGMNNVVNTRYSRAVKVTSANMNGFSAGVQFAPGNDQTISSSSTALNIPNARSVTEINLSYSKGPLNLAYTNVAQAAQTNGTGWYGSGAGTAGSSSGLPLAATSTNIFGGNFNMGSLTVYGALFNGNGLAATTTAQTIGGFRGAVKYSMGNVDLIAQYNETRTNNGTTETKASVSGGRIDYNLSKTGAAYIGLEKYDSGATSANQMDIVSVGLRKSF